MREIERVREELEKAEVRGLGLVTMLDDDYPANLRVIFNLPPFTTWSRTSRPKKHRCRSASTPRLTWRLWTRAAGRLRCSGLRSSGPTRRRIRGWRKVRVGVAAANRRKGKVAPEWLDGRRARGRAARRRDVASELAGRHNLMSPRGVRAEPPIALRSAPQDYQWRSLISIRNDAR